MRKNIFFKKLLLQFAFAALYVVAPAYAQKARIVVPKGHDNVITATCISDNQKYLATASRNTIIIWDLIKEKELYRLRPQGLSTTGEIKKLNFSDDNKVIIINDSYAYTVFTGEKLSGFNQSALKPTSPNGKYYLKISETYPDVTIDILETNGDKKINTITIPKQSMTGYFWNGGEILFYGPASWTLFNFMQNQKSTIPLAGKSYDMATADFVNDRIAFIERYRDALDLYDLKSGKLVRSKKASGSVFNIFYKENKLVAFQSELNPQKKESFYIVQLDKDGNQLKKAETILSGESTFFAANVFNSSGSNVVYNEGGKLKSYSITENKIRDAFIDKIAYYNSFAFPKIINQQHFNDSTFNVGIIASDRTSSGNIIFDKDNFRPKKYFSLPGKIIYTPDAKYAAGVTNSKIVVADNTSGNVLKEIKFPAIIENINSTSVFFNGNGTKIYIANYLDHHIAEIDISKGTLTKIISLEEEFFGAPGYSYNGKYVTGMLFNKKDENFKVVIDVQNRKVMYKSKMEYDDRDYYFLGTTTYYISENKIDGKRYIYNALDEKSVHTIEKEKSSSNYLGFDEANHLLAFQTSGYKGLIVEFYNLNGELVKQIPFEGGYTSSRVNFNDKGSIMYVPKDDKGIQVRETKNGELLGTYYFVENSNEYVFVSPEGLFDGSPQAVKELYLVKDFKYYSLDKFFEKFYTPNLLLRKRSGEKFSLPDIDNLLKDVKVNILYAEARRNLEVTGDVPSYVNTSGIAELTVSATAAEDKVDEIRLFHNGKAVNLATRGLFVTDNDGGDSKKYTINLLPGTNTFRAIALNSQRTESEPDEIMVTYKKEGDTPAPVKPDNKTDIAVDEIDRNATLHIVVVGINAYKNKINPLTYALPDATAFKAELEKDAKSMVNNVKSYLITDDEASKAGIVAAFDNIKKSAKPQDVFVFYYAGHGYIHPSNKEFYLVSSDVADGGESLLKNGVSAKELQTFAVDIPAQKQLFIMDACQSAGAFEKMLQHDGEQQKALAVVSRSTGTHWMAASGSTETAKEFGELGHGVFTYSLLEALKGKAVSNKMITVNGLKNYLQTIVPELVKKYGGNSQYPASYGFGNDFPVEIVK